MQLQSMAIAPAYSKKFVLLYNMFWPKDWHPVDIEMECIRRKGHWKKKNGDMCGEGLFFHHKRLQSLLHPNKVWHKWNELLLHNFIEHRIIGILGPASSGKSREASDFVRCCYYVYPNCTTVICSSTEKETLEDRVWGEIKSKHKEARQIYPDLPGHLIESKQRIVTDDREDDDEDGRDFRNGMVGVPCKKGGSYVGLGSYSGRKNTYVFLLADEGQFMPRAYVDAISNLNKNTNFKAIIPGNPKDTTDALGVICEPSAELGGWDGGIDQGAGTKTWAIRFPNGICVQLVGSESPNLDGKLGIPLITQEQINSDIAFYGKDSLQFSMMDEGRMPRGQGLRRVITRQMCLKFHAMEEPIWKTEERTIIGFLDAAYGAVGGDRTIFGWLEFGKGLDSKSELTTLLYLGGTMLVPVTAKEKDPNFDMPEDQIVKFVMDQCAARKIPPNQFGFDTTGRGSLMSAFCRLWSTEVQGIEFGGHASDRAVPSLPDISCKDYFSKFVSELWYVIRWAIESDQFRGMTDDVMQEGCYREWGFTKGNKIEVENKAKMKEKSGRSPDLFDGLACGVEMARRHGFTINRLVGVKSNQIYNRWKEEFVNNRFRKHRSKHLLDYKV